MSPFTFFTSSTARLRTKTEARLNEYSHPSADFFILIILASAIAAFGLLLNNTSIIIGAMVVAPLITPIFAFSLSLLLAKGHRMLLAIESIILGTFFAVATSAGIGFISIQIDPFLRTLTPEILSRAQPNMFFFLVALLSGIAGAYAYSRPKISAVIAGIAISVSLIPPLCATGVAIAAQQWNTAIQSFLLYSFNLLGIIFGSVLLFIIIGFGKDAE